MKLESMMKKYYAGRVNSTALPEMTGFAAPGRLEAAPRTRLVFDVVLNCAVHAVIGLVVVLGLPGLREESPLSMQITRIAVAISLDKYIESRVKLLSEHIIMIRNTR